MAEGTRKKIIIVFDNEIHEFHDVTMQLTLKVTECIYLAVLRPRDNDLKISPAITTFTSKILKTAVTHLSLTISYALKRSIKTYLESLHLRGYSTQTFNQTNNHSRPTMSTERTETAVLEDRNIALWAAVRNNKTTPCRRVPPSSETVRNYQSIETLAPSVDRNLNNFRNIRSTTVRTGPNRSEHLSVHHIDWWH
jgi:hypothetical protein